MTMERLCRQFALQSRASSLTSLSSSAMRHLSESFRSPSSASHLIVLGAAYASLSEVARRSGQHDARIMPGSEGLERSCRLSAQVEGLQVLAHFEIGRARVGTECVSTCRSRWSPYH